MNEIPQAAEEVVLPVIELQYSDIVSRVLFYPANKLAFNLAKMMRRKAFSKNDLNNMREAGFTLKIGLKPTILPDEYKDNTQ